MCIRDRSGIPQSGEQVWTGQSFSPITQWDKSRMPLAPIWRRSLRIAGNDTSRFFTFWASFPWSRKSSLWNSFDRQKGDDRLPCRPSSKTNKTGPAFSSRLSKKLKKSQRSGFHHFRETNWKSVVWIFLSPPWNSGTQCFLHFFFMDDGQENPSSPFNFLGENIRFGKKVT